MNSHPEISTSALAHLGDAVYSLWVREEAIKHHAKARDLHRYTTERVKAETQAWLLEQSMPDLSDDEKALAKRAENVSVPVGRRSNQAIYRKATAFEALMGYWYLNQSDACTLWRPKILTLLLQQP